MGHRWTFKLIIIALASVSPLLVASLNAEQILKEVAGFSDELKVFKGTLGGTQTVIKGSALQHLTQVDISKQRHGYIELETSDGTKVFVNMADIQFGKQVCDVSLAKVEGDKRYGTSGATQKC